MTSSPGSRARDVPERARSLRPILYLTVVGAVLWCSRLALPQPTGGPELDPSWEQGLAHALKSGFQWGADIVFSYGPLGSFVRGRYDPDLFWLKVLGWEIAFKGALAAWLALAVARVPGRAARVLFLVLLVLLNGGQDAYFFTAIVAVGAWLLARPDRPWPEVGGALAALSLIALVKFTFFALAVVAAACAIVAALRRSRSRALGVAALFAALITAAWCLCGQSPANLPAYVRTSWWIARDYGAAMSLAGPPETLVLGLGLGVVALGAIGLRIAEAPRQVESVLTCVLVAAGVTVAAKAGFTRHTEALTFFACASLTPFFLPRPAEAAPSTRRATSLLDAGCVALGIAGVFVVFDPEGLGVRRILERMPVRVARNVGGLFDLPGLERTLAGQREAQARRYELPRIRAEVGGAPVDMLGSRQGFLFLNDLDWRPRPAFQSYLAYAPELVRANARFLEGPHAPEYLILAQGSVDERLPNSEDGEALLVMLRDYTPLFRERGLFLLRRRADAPRPALERVVEAERTVHFGEEVALELRPDAVYLLALELEPSLAGRAIACAFRAPPVHVRVRASDGSARVFRLLPTISGLGVLVQPAPLDQAAWCRWLEGGPASSVASFEVLDEDASRRSFEPEIRMELVRVEGLAATLDAPASRGGGSSDSER